MATITLRASGAATAHVAWERYAVPDLWSRWAPQIVRVEASAARIAPGVRGTVVGPLGLRVTFVVDSVDDAARQWQWTVRVGPLRLRLEHGVTATAAGCATVLRIHGPLPVIAGYAPVARLALGRLVRP